MTGAAQAELSDVTGEDYSWVAYNNLGAVCEYVSKDPASPSAPANTTFWTYCGDHAPEAEPSSGELVRYIDGGGLNVTMTVTKEASNQLFMDVAGPNDPGAVFSDVYGSSVWGTGVNHGLGAQQLLTFTGLNPNSVYTFAGIATANSSYHDSLSTVVIQGAAASVNQSVLTSHATLSAFAGFGASGDTTYMSYLDDDLAMWTGISPGADGSFSVAVTSVLFGNRAWAPALNIIALGAEGSALPPRLGDFNGDGNVDADDIDLLRDNLGDSAFELDGQAGVDEGDFAHQVEVLAEWLSPNPGPGVGTAFGDSNLDGHVNAEDLALLTANFGATGGWADGNVNTDLLVDGTDLAIMMGNQGFGPPPEAAEAPEPATLGVLAVGAAALLKRRRAA